MYSTEILNNLKLTKKGKDPFIISHRGDRSVFIENSLPAFHRAIMEGANAIETDLRITRDEIIVCIHDADVDRTTNGTGRVDQLDWSQIRKLNLVSENQTVHLEAKIPSLIEILEKFSHQVVFLLELKASSFTNRNHVELLAKNLEDCNALNRVIVLSFNRSLLSLVNQINPTLTLAHTNLFRPWPSTRYKFVGVLWPLLYINPFFVSICHKRDQIVVPFDTSPEKRLGYYLSIGVDGLLSNYPRKTREAIKDKKKNH